MSDDNFSKTVIAARDMFGSLKRNIVMEPTVFADADLPWYQPLLDLEPYAGLVAQDKYIGVGAHGLAPWSPDKYGQSIENIKPLETQKTVAQFFAANRRGPVFDGKKIVLGKPTIDSNPYINSGLYFSGQYQNYIQQKMWYTRNFSMFVKLENVTSTGHVFGGLNTVSVPSYRLFFNFDDQYLRFEIGDPADVFSRISITFSLINPWQGFAVVVVNEDEVTLYADDDVYTYNLDINKIHSRRYAQIIAQTWILGHDVNNGNPITADLYAAALFDKRLTAAEVNKLKTIETTNEIRRKSTPFDVYEEDYPRMFAWLPENNLYNDQPRTLIPSPWIATNNGWMLNTTQARNPIVITTGALNFDGVDDRLYPSNLSSIAAKRTMIVRARNLGDGTILSTGGTNESFDIRYTGGNVEFHYNHATEGSGNLSAPLSDDAFHVIAVVIDETEMRLYVDGVEVDSVSGASWHFNTGTKRTILGARYNTTAIGQETDFFSGIISHLVIVDNDAVTNTDLVAMTELMQPDPVVIPTPILPSSVLHEYDVLKITGLSEGDYGETLPDTVSGFDLESDPNNTGVDTVKPIYRENAGDYGYPAFEFTNTTQRFIRLTYDGSPVVGESFTLMMLWRMNTPGNSDTRYWSRQNPNVGGSPTIVRNSANYYETYPFPGFLTLNFARPFEEDVHLQTLFASKADGKIYFSLNFDRFKEFSNNPYNGFPGGDSFIGLGAMGNGVSPLAYLYGCWIIPGELTNEQYQQMRTYIKARFPKLWEGNAHV